MDHHQPEAPRDIENPATADEALDTSHDAGRRGEHRYPDAHQTLAEQDARRERDALKRRLGGSGE